VPHRLLGRRPDHQRRRGHLPTNGARCRRPAPHDDHRRRPLPAGGPRARPGQGRRRLRRRDVAGPVRPDSDTAYDAAMPYVFAFDHKHKKPPMHMKDLLGGKGANLAEMTAVLELPVPPGFTITTDACRAYIAGGWPAGLDAEVEKHVKRLEKAMGKRLGDP